jgi:hypothetical protein
VAGSLATSLGVTKLKRTFIEYFPQITHFIFLQSDFVIYSNADEIEKRNQNVIRVKVIQGMTIGSILFSFFFSLFSLSFSFFSL